MGLISLTARVLTVGGCALVSYSELPSPLFRNLGGATPTPAREAGEPGPSAHGGRPGVVAALGSAVRPFLATSSLSPPDHRRIDVPWQAFTSSRTRTFLGHAVSCAAGVVISRLSRRWLPWCTRACSPARVMSARDLRIPMHCMLADNSLPCRCLQQPPPNIFLSIDDHDSVDALDRNSFLDLNRAGAFDEFRRDAGALVVYFIGALSSTSEGRAHVNKGGRNIKGARNITDACAAAASACCRRRRSARGRVLAAHVRA